MGLSEELKAVVAGDVHAGDDGLLDTYSRDASLFEVRPQVVVAPKDVEDVRALVRFASERAGVSLTARSGGTGMDGGALSESIVVDFTRHFSRVLDVHPEGEGGYGTVEPGAFYRDFERATLARGLIMPSYPASREICTVGGMVANNAGGELTLRYGKTEDYVASLKVIFADGNEYAVEPLSRSALAAKIASGGFEGEVYRKLWELIRSNEVAIATAKPNVHKNSAGYYLWNVYPEPVEGSERVFDLTKLIVGSQGTLCLITEITFRLVRPARHAQMLVVFLDDLSRLGELVATVLASEPTTFESYDDKTLKLAARFAWEFVKRLGVRNIFTLFGNALGELGSILRYGLPKLVLQITYEGDDPEALRERAAGMEAALAARFSPRYTEVIRSRQEADEYWLVRRESFNLLRHKVQGRKTAPFVDDISVRPEVLPEFFPKLTAIFEPYEGKMLYNIAGHIGDGNFHIIPLMDFTDPETREIIPKVAQQVYDLVLAYGGSITGEHNDGIIRTPFLEQQFGSEVYRLFEETKKIFDPKGIFNPGKKVVGLTARGAQAGTMDYALAHVKRTND